MKALLGESGEEVPRGNMFKNLQHGLLVDANEAATLEVEVSAASDVDMKRITRRVINLLWPSTTALTYLSPKGAECGESDFHKGRVKVAAGKCPLLKIIIAYSFK